MTHVYDLLLVDDDPMVRTGLSLILGGEPDLRIVAEAGDGIEGVKTARRLRPDVVLMDIRMPGRDGIEATRMLAADEQAPRILVLTTFDADDLVIEALRAGASGFLLKDTPPAAMVQAVRAVATGAPALSPTVAAQVIRVATAATPASAATDAGAPGAAGAAGPSGSTGQADSDGARRAQALADLDALTEREREVALAVARGSSNAGITAELFISVATVKTHISHVFDKLGVENRVQVAIRVHEAGLI